MESKINRLIAELELSISFLQQECKICGNNGRARRTVIINEKTNLVEKLKLILL